MSVRLPNDFALNSDVAWAYHGYQVLAISKRTRPLRANAAVKPPHQRATNQSHCLFFSIGAFMFMRYLAPEDVVAIPGVSEDDGEQNDRTD